MSKKCFWCGSTQLSSDGLLNKEWITENRFLGQYGQILKKITIGNTSTQQTHQEIMNTVYYCSMNCMHQQQDQEETEDWKKGKCKKCKIDLVVLNEDCQALEHLKEMKYMAIQTPDCMKKPKPKKKNCWAETQKYLLEEVLSQEKEKREEMMAKIIFNFKVAGDNPPCLDCRYRTLKLFAEWKKLD
ncbi:MAG: hypothetical protein I3270_02550 [Candidatus Moeniiplasma glomeromycotorum]|nr:hypothetical protein [Candidatus Moeniiplasma glomeromycotorum]MCE8162573.1 hypothetical protein [Candidatus Moeniiplasma glomeromycotorum]MCE8166503.1 hypothetical protein [Candidatus Moeniiplasma glomeromycotorum]MCE8166956.1 hypothetical protein [Candidatus Moeniiplasma glomeromycotorum]